MERRITENGLNFVFEIQMKYPASVNNKLLKYMQSFTPAAARRLSAMTVNRRAVESIETWYNRFPEAVKDNDQMKLQWDFRIHTDHCLDHNRPGLGCSNVE